MKVPVDNGTRQLDEVEIAGAVAQQIAGAPTKGAGSDLRRVSPEAEAVRLLEQRETPLGRIEAKQDAMSDDIKRIANLLGAAEDRGRGRPVDDRYQIIADFHAEARAAVSDLVANDEALKLGLLGALDRIKRKVERNLALRTHSGDGTDPTKAMREKRRRARKRATKASAT
jgi:hypothetical protein